MTSALAVLAGALALALTLGLVAQRRLAARLRTAGQRLVPELVSTGPGLAEATSLVERAVDRTVLRGADITEAEGRLVDALDAIPLGIVVFDEEGDIAFRNEVAGGYLARPSEALVEEAIVELSTETGRGGVAPAARTIELFGPPRRTLVLSGSPLQRRGKDFGVLVVIEDVTDRRRLEAVRRDFVANISHELKTPVGALALLAETLAGEDEPAVVRGLAERMLAEAFRVDRTIDDLLELSRIEASEISALTRIPVEDFVSEALQRVRPAADQQGIVLEVQDASARVVVDGDRRQLVSAVYNLLENAVKYSDPGSTVRVAVQTDGRWVDIVVVDEGIGIPRRDLERVFERFYRVDRARSRETGGTGLGLAIVRHVAGNHAGEVHVESQEGEGSTFTLRLPLGSGPVAVSAQAG